jgi:hypothetical protein
LGTQATFPLNENQRLLLLLFLRTPVIQDFIPMSAANHYKFLKEPAVRFKTDTINFQNQISVEFPMTLWFGISYVKENSVEINADYYHQAWSDVNLPGGGNEVLTIWINLPGARMDS